MVDDGMMTTILNLIARSHRIANLGCGPSERLRTNPVFIFLVGNATEDMEIHQLGYITILW